jgi:predicted enzyme related to lactoylglutathione lyase
MGERTNYSPGTFSWIDLTTTDQEGAKAFYGQLFGWQMTDHPVGEGVTYTIARLDGRDVAAISPQPEQQRSAGAPPTWNSYITVGSADEALERARQLGATVHASAFDVFDFGRMGVVQDPQGAFFLVWEPKAHIGAGLVNAAGALAWTELATTDLDASQSFYSELFGWTVEPMEGIEMPYRIIKTAAGNSNGGIRPTVEEERVAYWLVYFGTDDIDATVEKATAHGGKALAEPMDIGVGAIAVLQDPQGAVFALYSGRFDD